MLDCGPRPPTSPPRRAHPISGLETRSLRPQAAASGCPQSTSVAAQCAGGRRVRPPRSFRRQVTTPTLSGANFRPLSAKKQVARGLNLFIQFA